MATLTDRVNRTLLRRGGQLVEEAPTPTSQLAGQAGLVAPPTTAAGVGALGGTSKQQDMAGSGGQKASALRQALDSSTTLQEAEADKRYRSAMTSEEQAQADKQKRLGEVFGSTQSKVQSLINTEIEKQAGATGPALATAGVLTAKQGVGGTTIGNVAVSKDPQQDVNNMFALIAGELAKGTPPNDPNLQSNIYRLVALTGQTPEQIAAAASDAVQKQISTGAGSAAASAVIDASKVNVSSLLPQLGTSRDEVATLLGVDPSVVDTLSLDSLNEMIAAVGQQGASASRTAEAAQSTSLGAAERAALREQSIEQSTTGVAAAEAQLEDLARSLESADTIAFGGKNYSIEEFLADENISKLVSDYLTNPNSEQSKALAADPNAAGLLSFVNKYRDTLTDAASKLGAATTVYGETQKANKALATPVPGVNLSDTLMKAIYGNNWGSDTAVKRTPKGLVKALQELGESGVAKFKGALDEMLAIVSSDPGLAGSISNLSADGLKKLLTPNDRGVIPFKQLQENRAAEARVAAALESGNNADILAMYFDAPLSAGMDKAYSKDQIKVMAREISTALNKGDTAKEVSSGAGGWTPISLSARIAENEKKAAEKKRLRQEAVDKLQRLNTYLNKQKDLSKERKQEIVNNEMSWYVKNGYYP